MFGARMENRICGNGKGKDIVTPELRRDRKKNPKVSQHLAKLIELSSSGGQCSVFRLSGRSRDGVLFLCTPRNRIVA